MKITGWKCVPVSVCIPNTTNSGSTIDKFTTFTRNSSNVFPPVRSIFTPFTLVITSPLFKISSLIPVSVAFLSTRVTSTDVSLLSKNAPVKNERNANEPYQENPDYTGNIQE